MMQAMMLLQQVRFRKTAGRAKKVVQKKPRKIKRKPQQVAVEDGEGQR